MAGKKIGRQAVVIGAGMAGLAAAGALADYFERVIVLERDRLPNEAVPRPGTPQSRHLHGLLPGGQRALTDLFPHFERDLVDAGSVPLRTSSELRVEIPGLGPHPSRDFGWLLYGASRPLIELITRRQAERLTNLTVRTGYRVQEIITTPNGSMVTGVRCKSADRRQEILLADFVVDASGSGAPTLALLGSSGQPVPDEIVIGVDLHYTTAVFVIPQDASTSWKGIATHPHAPERSRGGYMLPIEGNRWVLTLTGRLGERPPAEPDHDQDRALLLRLAARGSDRRAGARGRVSLHGVPAPYRLALWCQHLFLEGAGAHRGAEQGLRARQRLGAKDRTPFLPQLRFDGVLVRRICPGPDRHCLGCVR